MNRITRWKAREVEKMNKVQEMREQLPVLNRREIRRYRTPHFAVVVSELLEDGCKSAAATLYALNEMHGMRIQNNMTASSKQLRYHKKFVEVLAEGFRRAEEAHNNENHFVVYESVLKVANFFARQGFNWEWLAEMLFNEIINLTAEGKDGGMHEALAKCAYGKFLMQKDPNKARELLKDSRERSDGRAWTMKSIEPGSTRTVFEESCRYLYEALLIIAKITSKTMPAHSSQFCQAAYRRACEIEFEEGKRESIFQKGIYLAQAKELKKAIDCFHTVLQAYTKVNDTTNMCRTLSQLASAYNGDRNFEEAENVLKRLETLSLESKDLRQYASCCNALGEFYLGQGKVDLGISYLVNAMNIYDELKDQDKVQTLRNTSAIATALGLLRSYLDLFNTKDVRASLGKILLWKESRTPFWEAVLSDGQQRYNNLLRAESLYSSLRSRKFSLP